MIDVNRKEYVYSLFRSVGIPKYHYGLNLTNSGLKMEKKRLESVCGGLTRLQNAQKWGIVVQGGREKGKSVILTLLAKTALKMDLKPKIYDFLDFILNLTKNRFENPFDLPEIGHKDVYLFDNVRNNSTYDKLIEDGRKQFQFFVNSAVRNGAFIIIATRIINLSEFFPELDMDKFLKVKV